MRAVLFLALLGLGGCSSALVVDRSIPAVQAGDYTLALSACESVPGGGMDVCRVKAGTEIDSVWTLYLPMKGKSVLGGEVDVYYRDVHRQYPILASVVQIPWKELLGSDVWLRAHDGEALALALVRWKTPEGLEEIVQFRGIAKIVVTPEGYTRLPMDSGLSAWGMNCEINYSTAGRSAVKCK